MHSLCVSGHMVQAGFRLGCITKMHCLSRPGNNYAVQEPSKSLLTGYFKRFHHTQVLLLLWRLKSVGKNNVQNKIMCNKTVLDS